MVRVSSPGRLISNLTSSTTGMMSKARRCFGNSPTVFEKLSFFMHGSLMTSCLSGMGVVGPENWTETSSSNLAVVNTRNNSDMSKIWTFVTTLRRVRAGNSEKISLVLTPFRSNDFKAGVEPPRNVAGMVGRNVGPSLR